MTVTETIGAIMGGLVICWPLYNAVFWFFESQGEVPWNWRALVSYEHYMNWLEAKELEEDL